MITKKAKNVIVTLLDTVRVKNFLTLAKAYRVYKTSKKMNTYLCSSVCCDVTTNGLLIQKVVTSLAGRIK